MFELTGKVAVVTGAATGIGRGIAVALAKQGAHVAVTDREGVSLEETKKEAGAFGTEIFDLPMDVASVEKINKTIAKVNEHFGTIDIIVNNAGINKPCLPTDMAEDSWDQHFDVNIKGGFFVAKAVAPIMIAKKCGRVIFISSQAGVVARPAQPAYCATKGAVIQVAKALAVDWAKHGITVNTVAPTFALTDISRERLKDPEYSKFVLGNIPVGRLVNAEEIGSAVVYLASDEAAMVTGHTLCVDGGWTII